MKRFLTYTAEERRASITGANIFFGALLGINLGAANSIDMRDYASLAFLLGGAVVGLCTVAVTERRSVMIQLGAIYMLLLGALLLDPSLRPERMDEEVTRVVATLAIWFVFIVIVRLMPILQDPPPHPATSAVED